MSLIIKSLTYFHPDRTPLFDSLDMTLGKGEKASLVGANGAGKSTLMRLIAGKWQPSAGLIRLSEKPWYVPQHLGEYNHLSVATALGIDEKLKSIRAILKGDTDPQNFAGLEDDWEIEDKTRLALEQWHLPYLTPDHLLEDLSGGEKTRLFLAGITLHQPAIILLDEPTNHLDAAGRQQLYQLIGDSKAAMLVISHDRSLLNLLPQTYELNNGSIQVYGGNYEFYREQRQIMANAIQDRLDEQIKTLKQTQLKAREMTQQRQKKEARGRTAGQTGSLPRILAGGRKTKAEQSTAKLIGTHQDRIGAATEKIEQIRTEIRQYQPLKIAIGSSALHRGKTLVDAKHIGFSYDGTPLWDTLSFQLRSGDRVHIGGDNGAGKTTLLKIITGVLQPSEGEIYRTQYDYLYLDQDYSILAPGYSIYEQLRHYDTRGLEEHELKSLLIHAQFPREMFDSKCAGLSGGEKMKLSLCCLAVNNAAPDMLILDEPANNLDLPGIEILSASLKEFSGTLLIISHDRYFIDEIGIDKDIIITKRKQYASKRQ